MTRPSPPADCLDGYQWLPREEDPALWRPARDRKCSQRGCQTCGVVELRRPGRSRPRRTDDDLYRGDGHQWWAYCLDHGYDRWTERQLVWAWVLFPVDLEPPTDRVGVARRTVGGWSTSATT